MGTHRASRMAILPSLRAEEPRRSFVVSLLLPACGCRSVRPQNGRKNVSGTAAVVWVFFTMPNANGIRGEHEITGFPIFRREITLENSPQKGPGRLRRRWARARLEWIRLRAISGQEILGGHFIDYCSFQLHD
jgi:hypothetical protein